MNTQVSRDLEHISDSIERLDLQTLSDHSIKLTDPKYFNFFAIYRWTIKLIKAAAFVMLN